MGTLAFVIVLYLYASWTNISKHAWLWYGLNASYGHDICVDSCVIEFLWLDARIMLMVI